MEVATNDASCEQQDPVPTENDVDPASNPHQCENDQGQKLQLNCSCEEAEADSTIHGFNISNITVIERAHCEGSDSGVEVVENAENCTFYQRALSTTSGNSLDLNGVRSCDSSIISCCSNYEEAYQLLVRKNSTLLEDFALRNGDVTSDNGSESSSLSGTPATSHHHRRANSSAKKKVSLAETKQSKPPSRSRSKPPINPKTPAQARVKSIDRLQGKPTTKPQTKKVPTNLDVTKPRTSTARTTPLNRTPTATPTDDGRWPSINIKPGPLMSRSLRGTLETPTLKSSPKLAPQDTKTIEKYATIPRRRKEKPDFTTQKDKKPRESSIGRLALPKRSSSRDSTPCNLPSNRIKHKTKIYHETSIQTALTSLDLEEVLSGGTVIVKMPEETEKSHRETQVDLTTAQIEKLEEKLKLMTEKYDNLNQLHVVQSEALKNVEQKLREETLEKNCLKQELENNSKRVLAIIGADQNDSSEGGADNLRVLETRFQNVGQVIVQQEEEISRLNTICRNLQRDLENSIASQANLIQQHQESQQENLELQDFLQAEKSTLGDALKEAETEIQRQAKVITQKEKQLKEKLEECLALTRQNEQRKHDTSSLQAKLTALESQSRDLLVHQGSSVSGAAVALSALISRLGGLVEELVEAYSISDQELDDVIFHNEVYNNSSSSPESTPEKSRKVITDKVSSPKSGSSFVSAVINAIKNAAAQTPFTHHKDLSNLTNDHSSSNEMLDSETEPCLMMEHVLEDVVVPDGHSHNMISSGGAHNLRLTQSESLKDLSQAMISHQRTEPTSLSCMGSLHTSFTSDLAISLVDQVIDVDNVITRLLKVIRLIQLENEDCMTELQDHRDNLADQIDQQKQAHVEVVKQLREWELLGARLKTEVKELMMQLSKKNAEIDNMKSALNEQREEVEKLNQDVCELSTALAKVELEMRMKEEEVAEEIVKWEKSGESPPMEMLAKLVVFNSEIPRLREKLADKERRLAELTQEFIASKQVLTENLRECVSEAKKQYLAIDNALEVFHSIQQVVQQCPPLAKLQRDLEESSFQSASVMPLVVPPDCNANAALLQAVANMEITAPINTTA